MTDKYFFVIDGYNSSEIKIKSSLFICHLHQAETIEHAKEFISSIGNKYKDATHNCWAYITGKKADIFHSSDSGEPAGTAGKPILNTLQKHNLTNIVAVVTRYYGGTKLGVRGLIDAYSEITELTVLNAEIKKLVEICKYEIDTAYDFVEILKHQLISLGAEIENIEYSESIKLNVIVEEFQNEKFFSYISSLEKRGKLNLKI